ncbi:Phage protein [Candidatus Arthromitus sp. SFB-mouse-NL]|nr:Phage protein [Candidatus Arthromitus sp. SFB-mouse-NL]
MQVLSIFAKFFFRPIIFPLVAMLLTDFFNIAEYIRFIPSVRAYEFGLTIYIAIFEMIYQGILIIWDKYKLHISFIFYISEMDKSDVVPCARGCEGVFMINYFIKLHGNLNRLNKCKMYLDTNPILGSQTRSDYYCEGNTVVWDLDKIRNSCSAKMLKSGKLSLIKERDEYISLELRPKINKKWGIIFETNGFRIDEGRD